MIQRPLVTDRLFSEAGRSAIGFGLLLAVAAVVLTTLQPCASTAAVAKVPHRVQADLVSKVAAYDRGFRDRAKGRVHVLVLSKPGSAASVRAAQLMRAALARQQDIAGLPHDVHLSDFDGVESLKKVAEARSATIVYVTPGFDAELPSICTALEPLKVLTVTAVPRYVERCIVLGFAISSGRPKLLIHLEQAKKNGIRFKSDLLKLATVYR